MSDVTELAAPAPTKDTKTETERKVELFELGLPRGPVVVRFDARKGVVGVTLDEKEEEHRAPLTFTKETACITSIGLSLHQPGDVELQPNLIPWEAVWAVEGKGEGACGFFPKSCPSEHTQALFMQCLQLRSQINGLSAIVQSAMKLVDIGAPNGQWRRWRAQVAAIINPKGAADAPRIITP